MRALLISVRIVPCDSSAFHFCDQSDVSELRYIRCYGRPVYIGKRTGQRFGFGCSLFNFNFNSKSFLFLLANLKSSYPADSVASRTKKPVLCVQNNGLPYREVRTLKPL